MRCVSGSSGKAAAEVDRPSILKSPLFPVGLLAFICGGGYAAWRVYNSPIVRITWLWALGALAVFWFATSGGMYNIIRGIPLYYNGPNGKLVWWMEVGTGVRLLLSVHKPRLYLQTVVAVWGVRLADTITTPVICLMHSRPCAKLDNLLQSAG